MSFHKLNAILKSNMKKSVKNLQDSFIKFHGCGVYRRDGSNVLSTKKRPCNNPINVWFWMLGKDVIKKVRTRNKEFNERVYYSQSLKNQYQRELIKRKQYQYYSTDEDSDTDIDTDTESNDSHKLVIDIQNITKSISDSVNNIKETLTQIKTETKNTDQDLGFFSDNK